MNRRQDIKAAEAVPSLPATVSGVKGPNNRSRNDVYQRVYFPDILRGIEQVLSRYGYAFISATCNRVDNEREIRKPF